MSLGAARAGFDLVGAIDNDSRALNSHSRNFPNCKHFSIDLSQVEGKQILDQIGLQLGEIDLVFGGPPCQGFSPIGKRNIDDDRNDRLVDFFRLVGEIKPRAFVAENVPGVLGPPYSKVLKAAQKLVEKDYYLLDPYKLKATTAGAPTIRTRVVMIGFQSGIVPPSDFWSGTNKTADPPVVKFALQGLPHDVHPNAAESRGGKRIVRITRKGSFFEAVTGRVPQGVGDPISLQDYFEKGLVTGCKGTIHSRKLERRYAALDYGEMDPKTKSVKLDPNGFCPTLRAGTGSDRGSFQAVRPIHYLRPRVITPREAARLQGFPDWFQFDETKWHSFRQLGNSVSPLVSEFIMLRIARVLSRG